MELQFIVAQNKKNRKDTMPDKIKMSAEHRKRHEQLHKALDELVADYIGETKGLPSNTTILELINWSHEKTRGGTENE